LYLKTRLALALLKGLAECLAENSGTAGLAWKRHIVSSEILRIQWSITKASFLQASTTIQGGGGRIGQSWGGGVPEFTSGRRHAGSGESVVLYYEAIHPFLEGPQTVT